MTPVFQPEDGLEETLRRLLAERAADPGEHPEPEELLDYHLGALPPEDEERVADHLARCAECARLVLDYHAFSAPAAASPALPRAELDRAWVRFAERRAPTGRGRWWNAQAPAWLLAASLLLTAGLFLWGRAGHQGAPSRQRPDARVTLAFLDPLGQGIERAAEAPERIVIRPGIEQVAITLGLADTSTARDYRMELRTEGGRVLWSDPKAPRDEKGTFTVLIPAELLQPGLYRIRLSEAPAAGQRARLVAEYRFEAVRASLQS